MRLAPKKLLFADVTTMHHTLQGVMPESTYFIELFVVDGELLPQRCVPIPKPLEEL